MRGFGGPEAQIIIEEIVDRIAHELKKDPKVIKEVPHLLTLKDKEYKDGLSRDYKGKDHCMDFRDIPEHLTTHIQGQWWWLNWQSGCF